MYFYKFFYKLKQDCLIFHLKAKDFLRKGNLAFFSENLFYREAINIL